MTGETVTNDAVLNEPTKDARPNLWLSKAIRRYWGEAAVVALALLLWVPRLSGPIDLRWDAGVYYVLGTSLASGHGYRILSEPGSPEALQYPPLLPALVALHQRALGSTDAAIIGPWLRLSYATLFLFYALSALALARRYLRAGFAVVAVAISLLQVNTLFMSDLLFTELPFVLVSVLFALVAVDGPFASRPWIRETLSFLLAAAGFLFRTAGVALLIAWVLEAFVRRQWRLALMRGVLVLLPVVAWQAHVMRVRASYEYAHPAYQYQRASYQFYNVSYAENVGPAGSSHPDSLHTRAGALVGRLTKNVCRMGERLGEAISTSEGYWRDLLSTQQLMFGRRVIPPSVVLVPIVALSVLVVTGIGILLYRRIWLVAFILLVSITLICTTPWPDQFQRYLMPLTPFLAIAALLALLAMHNSLQLWLNHRPSRIVGKVLVTGLLLLPLILQVYTASAVFYVRKREGASFVPGRGAIGPRLFYYDRLWYGWEQAVAWIMQHSGPDAIVATPACHLCYLRSGRHAVAPPKEEDRARNLQLLESVPVSFVIVDRGYSLAEFEIEAPGWRLVQSFDGTRLYENMRRPQ